jgi:hypothetical protein
VDIPFAPVTTKVTSIYAAYAPEFDLTAWGGCQDEALNNLAEAIRERQMPEQGNQSPQKQ